MFDCFARGKGKNLNETKVSTTPNRSIKLLQERRRREKFSYPKNVISRDQPTSGTCKFVINRLLLTIISVHSLGLICRNTPITRSEIPRKTQPNIIETFQITHTAKIVYNEVIWPLIQVQSCRPEVDKLFR